MDDDDDSKIFPQRLMEILGDETNQEAICWLPHGRAFIVRNRTLFSELVMPKYFSRKAKYSSFARKLNRWNFVRVSSGPELGAYYHEFFLRDKPHLAAQMFCKNARTKLAMANETSATPAAAVATGPATTSCPSVEATTAAFAKASVSQPAARIAESSTSWAGVTPERTQSLQPVIQQPQLPRQQPQQQIHQQQLQQPPPVPQQSQQHGIPQLPSDVPLALLQQILSKSEAAPMNVEESNGPTPSVLLQQAQYASMLVERQIQILQREQAKRMVLQSMQQDRSQVLSSMSAASGTMPQAQPTQQMTPQRLLQMQQLMQMQRQRKANRPINHRASAA